MTYGKEELINKLRYCGNAVSCLHCPYWEGCAGSKEVLIEAADAIEELKILADNGEATYEIMVRQTSYIEELKQKIPHWIPVEEKLPEEKTYVLILADTIAGKMEKVSFLYKDSEGRNCWTALDGYGKNLFDWQPTHWMPLPEPPKEGE